MNRSWYNWSVEHPAAMAWLLAHPDHRFNNLPGHPNGPQTRALEGLIGNEAASLPNNPAEAWHALRIPNGEYRVIPAADRVLPTNGEGFRYRIHLVQRGPLAGKRIIKVWKALTQRFEGFAFLTRGGHLVLWQRFAGDAPALYVQTANDLITYLRDGPYYANNFSSHRMHCAVTRSCSFCNGPVVDSTHYRCATHTLDPDDRTNPLRQRPSMGRRAASLRLLDPELERLVQEEQARQQVRENQEARIAARPRPARPARRPLLTDIDMDEVTRSPDPLMDELGHGYIR